MSNADDIADLTAEVRGMRSDLGQYRASLDDVIGTRLRRLMVVGLVALLFACTLFVGSLLFLENEQARSEQTLATAQAQACATARTFQSQLLQIINRVPEAASDFVRDSLLIVAEDPCASDPHGGADGR
jgi:Tfp pilus assembly protein PilN